MRQNRPDLAAAPAAAPVRRRSGARLPAAPRRLGPSAGLDPVAEKVLELVAQKTGYPRDMLELDLDLEADLGIDTVKQAEVFGMVREHFNIPRQDNVKLREYPTLKHVIGFVRQYRPDLGGAPAPAAARSAQAAVAAAAAPAIAVPAGRSLGALPGAGAGAPPGARAVQEDPGRSLQKGSRVVIVADKGGAGDFAGQDPRAPRAARSCASTTGPSRGAFEAPHRRVGEGRQRRRRVLPERPRPRDAALRTGPRGLAHAAPRAHQAPARAGSRLYDSLAVTGTFFLAATRLGGLHGYGPAGQSPAGGAVTGFVKALRPRAAPTPW